MISLVYSMPPKRTLTSETPAITLDVIRQLTANFTAALEAQTAAMASASNLTGTLAVKTRNILRVFITSTFLLQWNRRSIGHIAGFERTEISISRSRCA
ncbi:hypothetical protein Tco_0393431 [Tanacetum coccineum]